MGFKHLRLHRLLAVAGIALVLGAGIAEARVGGGSSFGSRGSRTYSAPPPTATAPRQAAPLERSMTQPGYGQSGYGGMAQPSRGLFGGGFGSALMGGLIGAGLFGLLFGHGLFGGFSGIGSLFGLLLQIGLIVFLVSMAMRFFRNRAGLATAGGPLFRSGPMGGVAPRIGGGGDPRGTGPSDEIGIGPADYEAFERALGEIQTAYGREDLNALRRLASPEMVSNFAEDLAQNAARGLVNRTGDVKLLKGDLAEAWRERDADYATVAMRFSLKDAMIERDSGRVVEGDLASPIEVTEVWTFRRAPGGPWMLSAIQQG